MHRAQQHLNQLAREYRDIWLHLDEARADLARRMTWPQCCWMPSEGTSRCLHRWTTPLISPPGYPMQRLMHHVVVDMKRVTALGAWRPTQGIYRFDPDVLEELWFSTVDSGLLPTETLEHMPEWCVYLETPNRTLNGMFVGLPTLALHGFFAFMDMTHDQLDLRLLLDAEEGFFQLVLPLGNSGTTLVGALEHFVRRDLEHVGLKVDIDACLATISPLLSVVLYVCSSGEVRPSRPSPTIARREKTPRFFPPSGPHVQLLGERLGSALRAGRHSSSTDSRAEGAVPIPHVRRAHWHTFVLGPRDAPNLQRRELRWLPPIFVGHGTTTEQAVVRFVT